MQNKKSKWTLNQLVVNRISNYDPLFASLPPLGGGLQVLQERIQKERCIRTLKLGRIKTELTKYPTGNASQCVLQFIHHRIDVIKTMSVWLLDQVKKANIAANDTSPFLYILKAHRNDGILESLWECYNLEQQQVLVDMIMANGGLFSDLLSRDNVEFCEVIWLRSSEEQRARILNERFLVTALALNGVQSTLEWLWTKANAEQRQQLLHFSLTNGLMRPLDRAVPTGNLRLCVWLYQQLSTVVAPVDLLANVLSIALEHRCFDIATWAWNTADNTVKMRMLLKLNVVSLTSDKFTMDRVRWMFQHFSEDYINAIYLADNCCLFRFATAMVKTELLHFLWVNASDKQKPILYSTVNFDQVLEDHEIEDVYRELVAVIKASQVDTTSTTNPQWNAFSMRDTLYFFTQVHPNFIDEDDQDEHHYELEKLK